MDLVLALLALAAAVAARPWRALGAEGPPWPWLAWCAVLPAFWCADRLAPAGLVQPLSGACLLMLMAGWPLAVLALVPVTLATAWLGDLSAAAALQRGVWLGLMPATFGMLLGAGVRRWLPHHLMVYILGRGFFATLLAGTLAGAVSLAVHGGASTGVRDADLMLGRWLAAWSDAILTGMLTAIAVAFRPQWLATYDDRIYLPR